MIDFNHRRHYLKPADVHKLDKEVILSVILKNSSSSEFSWRAGVVIYVAVE